jgi:hypothetical protein
VLVQAIEVDRTRPVDHGNGQDLLTIPYRDLVRDGDVHAHPSRDAERIREGDSVDAPVDPILAEEDQPENLERGFGSRTSESCLL